LRLFHCLPLVFGCVVIYWSVGIARAHSDLHERIASLTQQIKRHPRDARLYLKRGELHRFHSEWQAAEKDYDRATKLDPHLVAIKLERGKLFLATQRPQEAKLAFDQFLTLQPDHTSALLLRARTLVQLHQHVAAAADFTRALALMPEPTPDPYLERAQALISAGPDHFDEALRGLDEGITRLGPLVTLQLQAIDLECSLKRYDSALHRLAQVTAGAQRKEGWLVRKAEILEQAGRGVDARTALTEALAVIAALPPRQRNQEKIIALDTQARDQLARLSAPSTEKPHSEHTQ
jgi:tetratricopeptide (TPR) repeat protein